MRQALLVFGLVLLLPACNGSDPWEPDDDDDVADDDTTAGDDDTTAGDDDVADDDVADDDVADDDDMGPCESGICELSVLHAEVGCDLLPDPDPMPPGGILVTSPAAGQVAVMHFNHSQGCCPQMDVSGLGYMNSMTIEVQVDLYDDFCDCICTLELQYTLGDVPAGSWTAYGQVVEVL